MSLYAGGKLGRTSRSLRPCLLLAALLASGCGGSYSAEAYKQAPSPGEGYRSSDIVAVSSDTGGWGGGYFESLSEEAEFDDSEVSGTLHREQGVETAQAEPMEPKPAEAATPQEPESSEEATKTPSTRRIVIYSAAMTLYVLEVEVAMQKAIAWADELEGWVQGSTSTSVTLRVPAQHFKQLLGWARELGEVRDENIVGQDVTEEFMDLEIRLRNALEMRDRYVELLAKATEVKEILAIEAELGRITEEIERFKGRLRYLSENARFSTVTLQFVQAPERYSRSRHVELPFAWLRGYSLRTMYSYY